MLRRIAASVAAAAFALATTMPSASVAAASPAVSLSATSLNFGSVDWLHDSPAQTIVVTNSGDAPLAIQSVDISGEPFVPVDFRVSLSADPCPPSYLTLAPGAHCGIVVTFRPQSGGPRSATMTIWDNAPGSPQAVSLSGTGTGAVIMFTPRNLDFGTVPAGTTSAPLRFSVVNAGDGPVSISKIALGPLPWYSPWFAITGDGCTSTILRPGQRCTISISATPDAVSSGAQIVTLYDDAGTGQQTYDGSIIGLEVRGGGPLASIWEPFQRSYNQGVGTASLPSRIHVFDAGTQPLQISSVTFDNPSAGFTIIHDGCSGVTLPLNAPFTTPPMCDVDVVFSPPSAGSANANLVIHDNELAGSHAQQLTGNGYAPAAVLSSSTIDFGFQAVGASSTPQVVTLTNPSPQPLAVNGVTLSGTNPALFKLTSDSCSGTTVAAGASCAVGVAFTPPFAFLVGATLSFNDNAPVPPQTVSLRGEGQSPTFTISASYLNFGNQHALVASAPQTINVTNTSSGTMSYGFLPASGIVASGCTGPIAAGASCIVSVSVNPPGVGAQSGTFKVVDSASNQQVVQVDWTGTTGLARIEGSIGGLIIQQVGTTLTRNGVVINGGSDVLKIGQINLTNNAPAAITADKCSNQSLPVGGSCILTLTINPTVAGGWSNTLTVATDAALGPNPATVVVQGVAAPAPQPVFFPASISFPDQRVGGETTAIVWVDNGIVPALGSLPMTISSVGLGGPDASAFRIVWDGCSGLSIDSAYSCPVSVGFDPAAGRTFNASLLFNDDGNGSPQAVSLSGLGLAPAASPFPQQLDFGNVVVRSRSASATVTLKSTGNVILNVSRVALSGPNKGDYTITSESCQGKSLVPGVACQVVIEFRPEALGTRLATLTFTDNGSDSPQSVSLRGVGISR